MLTMYHNRYALNPIGFYFLKHQHFERIYLYVFVISIHLLGVHLPANVSAAQSECPGMIEAFVHPPGQQGGTTQTEDAQL